MIWQMLALTVGLSELSMLNVSVYLHRTVTHRAVWMRPICGAIAQLFLWLLTPIRPREWVAAHRWHHRHVDDAADIHSPHQTSLWRVVLGSTMMYAQWCRHNQSVIASSTSDVVQASWFRLPRYSGLLISIALLYPWLGWAAAFVVGVQVVVLGLGLGLINGIGHHPTKSSPTEGYDSAWVAWLCWGEGLHRCHHDRPRRANLGGTGQVDLGYQVVRCLVWLGLATLDGSNESTS